MSSAVLQGSIPEDGGACTVNFSAKVATGPGIGQEVHGIAILDIGSKQCVLNDGALDPELFNEKDGTFLVDGLGSHFECRFRELVIRIEQGGTAAEFTLPVYSMPVGRARFGTRLMLIGRTLLNQGVLTYDGPNGKWTLAFPG